MIRHAPERRYADPLLWRHPVLLEAELAEYAEVDRRLDLGATCGACGRRLDYPLVEVLAGTRAVRLHPDCARRLAHGLLRDVEEIEEDAE